MAQPKRRRTGASAQGSLKDSQSTQSRLSFRSTKFGHDHGGYNNTKKAATPASDDEERRSPIDDANKISKNSSTHTEVADVIGPMEIRSTSDEREETPEDALGVEAALALSKKDVDQYWSNKEQDRIAPRVHQESLKVSDKVLREFDMTSKFGPSIGITRTARWKRAKRMGLDPPLEVLSIILNNDHQKADNRDRSIVDELMMTSRNDE